jgi:hypothetical protein
MRGLRVMVDWLCYARPSLAARSFGTLRHRGREAYSSHEGQSRCAAPCSFHCQPRFEMSGRARASTAPAPKLSLTMTPSGAVVGNWYHKYLASPGRRVSRFTYRRQFMLPRRRTYQIGPRSQVRSGLVWGFSCQAVVIGFCSQFFVRTGARLVAGAGPEMGFTRLAG